MDRHFIMLKFSTQKNVPDEEWIRSLMRIHYRDIFNYGKKICPDEKIIKDSIQKVFIQLWKERIENVDIRASKLFLLKSLKSKILEAWEATSAHNKSRHSCRYDFIHQFNIEKQMVSRAVSTDDRGRFQGNISSLSQMEKEAVYLKFIQMLPDAQIAELMDVQPQVVHNMLQESILKLHEC